MQNLDILPVDQSVKDDIRLFRDKLLGYAGIKVDVLSFEEGVLKVRVEQKELKNNHLLSQSQLVNRAGSVFAPLENRYKVHYVALTYKPDLADVDKDWINAKLQEFKLSRNDLIKQLEIDKSTLSELLSGNRSLTKFQKAAFYYYFMTFELNRDVREFMAE